MDLIKRGDRGTHVLDVQRRLARLGFTIPGQERPGTFGEGTALAVQAFQQARGVLVDGIVGADTWRELVEAGWHLGDRVLYLRAPHLTGDDVRELQDKLATFGFDVGRIDGIFGARTDQTIREFQRNYGLPPDGLAGERTVRALRGLPARAGDMPAAVIREREAMRARPQGVAGLRVVIDPGHGGADPGNIGPSGAREDLVAFEIARHLEANLAAAGAQVFLTRREDNGPTESERAALANALDAEIFLGLHLGGGGPRADGAAAFYFGHERFRSEGGARLAEILLEDVCSLGIVDGRAHAKTFPALRETRMTAVLFEPATITNPEEESLLLDHSFQVLLAGAIGESVRRFTQIAAGV